MLTLLPFFFSLAFTLCLNISLFPYHVWQISLTIVFYILCVIAANGIIATIICKLLPNKWFKGGFYNPSKNECNFYDRIKIKMWKDDILELGALNGFRKNKIVNPSSPEYIQKFILENNKGFLTHFLSIFIAIIPLFALPQNLWLSILLPVALTNFILNFMPLAALRYNIPRLQTALRFAARNIKED